jgi:signal transduction histidine kinase
MDTVLTTRPDNTPFRVAQDKQTYTNILYLLLSFPLGICYFVFLVTGIALGGGTLIIWIGVPILLFTIEAWWRLAIFERQMAIRWLRVDIAPLAYPVSQQMSLWRRAQARLMNAMTWKTLAYLLLKFPQGILSFVLTVTLFAITLVITIVGTVLGLLTAPFVLLYTLLFGNTIFNVRHYLLWGCLGFGLTLLSFFLLNELASIAGQFARVMLGMSESAMRLAEAKAVAEQERIRAEQADQRRRELVVNVSHELRTPVASISGHVESLLLATQEGTVTPPNLYNYLSVVHSETMRLSMLIDDLLSLARAETGELRLTITSVVASEIVEEVYHALEPLAQRERQVTLVRGAASHLPLVLADRQRLAQVLLNLVRNAITSTPAGGIVEISIEQPDAQHLAFVVADNGIGIATDDLAHIFERFYRADSSRSRSSGGFGLGLAIVHDFVTAMNGSITVTSEVGKGSRFCVVVPVATY